MSNHKSKKPSRRVSSSESDDCGCMPSASNTMAGENGEPDTLHLMPGSEDISNISAAGMHANDDT